MNLTYNNFAIHNIGEVTISQSREFDDGQRAKVTLKIGVTLFERSYHDNYALVQGLQQALKTQQAVLQWRNTDTDTDYLNQTVTLQSSDLPETWGTYQMDFNLVFFYFEQDLVTNNLPMSFAGVTLGNVTKFAETFNTERFSLYQSARKTVRGRVAVSGYLLADATLSLAARRTALITAKTQLKSLNQAEGVLAFGTAGVVFNQTVRIEELTAEVDQLHNAISWTFSASYTVFPDEATFATVEFAAEQKEPNTGIQFLAFSGKVTAKTEAVALAKLAALTTTVVAAYGYNAASEQLRNDVNSHQVSPNGDAGGDFFTELDFSQEYRRWRSDNQTATFKKTGGTAAVSFGNVNTWELHYSARRFVDMRSQRQRAGGTVTASGTWLGDPTANVTTRRTALLAAQAAMLTEVNNADGTLAYGSFSQVVRIEDLKADINQALTGINWSFTASYSLFPDESGYATVDFTVAQNSNAEDGEETLTFGGTILAPDEAMARTKLGTLRTTMLANYGFNINQQLRPQSTARSVFANGDKTATLSGGHEATDGTSFIELTFSEEYRRRRAALVSWTMQTGVRVEAATGLQLTTNAGTVVASGSSVDAAYSTALQKAESLGQAPIFGAFIKSSQINWEQRQIQAGNTIEFVRLNFSYEFQAKTPGNDLYLEVATETSLDTFGIDTVSVSGFIVAVTAEAAMGAYTDMVISSYLGGIIQNERTSIHQVSFQSSGGNTLTQDMRLDFGFTVFKTKSRRTGYRYAIDVSNDYLTLTRSTRIQGSVSAASVGDAIASISGLVGPYAGGSLIKDDVRSESEGVSTGAIPSWRLLSAVLVSGGSGYAVDNILTFRGGTGTSASVRVASIGGGGVITAVAVEAEGSYSAKPSSPNSPTGGTGSGASLTIEFAFQSSGGTQEGYVKTDFDYEFVDRIVGQAGVVECRVSETVRYSGVRWVLQPIPRNALGQGGITIPQDAGVQEGGRQVRGSVTAASLFTAQGWAEQQRALLSGDDSNNFYPQAEEWETDYEFVPRVDGVAIGGTANVRLYRVNFTFSEILPNYFPV